jgi:hypothetical protein
MPWQASARYHVLNHGVGVDLSFTYKKIKLCRCADCPRRPRVEKQSSKAHVAHSRNVFTPIAIPTNPDFLAHRNSRVEPSGG